MSSSQQSAARETIHRGAQAHYFAGDEALLILCRENKVPFPGYLKRGAKNMEQFKALFEAYPTFTMLSSLTGGPSGNFQIDIDPRNGGQETFDALVAKYGDPGGKRYKTRNGFRLVFAFPRGCIIRSRCGKSGLGAGVDVRGGTDTECKGHCVCPPTVGYEWEDKYAGFYGLPHITPAWLFLLLFSAQDRDRLVAIGIKGPEGFGGAPPATWVAAAKDLRRKQRVDRSKASGLYVPERRLANVTKYVKTGIADEVDNVRCSEEGHRNETLNTSALLCWSLLKGLEQEGVNITDMADEVYNALGDAANDCGLEEHEFESIWSRTENDAVARDLVEIGYKIGERPVLKPSDPFPSAVLILSTEYWHEGLSTLIHTADGDFLKWQKTHYERLPEQVVKNEVYRYLDGADRMVKEGDGFKKVRFEPNNNKVANVVGALQAAAGVSAGLTAPAWLPGAPYGMPPANEMLPVANGLLHIPTRKLYPHTPAFLHLNSVPYAYDPAAARPVHWLGFLESLWRDDQESHQLLQEWMGYCLTLDTRQQKMLLMVGSKRGGKGTIGRIQREMVGPDNVAGPTLSSFGGTFGLEPLLDKQLAIVSDARMGKGALTSTVLERLLTLSGEDAITVDRKHEKAVHGRLTARVVIISNELPNIPDASGALASRFLILNFNTSFLDREDTQLEVKLRSELPGILNWALDGLSRLTTRGRFVQPRAAGEVVKALEDLTSPIGAFIRDACELGEDHLVRTDSLYSRWLSWCHSAGERAISNAEFGRMLSAHLPEVRRTQRRIEGSPRPIYEGIGLKSQQADVEFADLGEKLILN